MVEPLSLNSRVLTVMFLASENLGIYGIVWEKIFFEELVFKE